MVQAVLFGGLFAGGSDSSNTPLKYNVWFVPYNIDGTRAEISVVDDIAIGGIGVERYQIEEIATRFIIPVHAILVKQSVKDATTVMRKEISDSFEK